MDWSTVMKWLSAAIIALGGVQAVMGLVAVGQGFGKHDPSATDTGVGKIVGGAIIAAAGGLLLGISFNLG